MMKKQQLHLVILMALTALLGWNSSKAMAATYNIDLRNGMVAFLSSGAVYQLGTKICDHEDSNVYVFTSGGVATPYWITIETVNVGSGGSNRGSTYNITLNNVFIDRSREASVGYTDRLSQLQGMYFPNANPSSPVYHVRQCLAPFNAGDDTVDVNITLLGTNKLYAAQGGGACLQYSRFDGSYSTVTEGVYETGITGKDASDTHGKLTINGTGSLEAMKPAFINSGPCIGCFMCGVYNDYSVNRNSSNGDMVFNGGTITAYFRYMGEGTYESTNLLTVIPYGAAIGGAACCRAGNITIDGATVNATSYATTAAIGGGGGEGGVGGHLTGTILIKSGTVRTYSYGYNTAYDPYLGVKETGVGIGAGSAMHNGGGYASRIEIQGGTVIVKKWDKDSGSLVDGNIGGGNSNMSSCDGKSDLCMDGGSANVYITGGNITAANICGGSAQYENHKGGTAYVEIDMGSTGVLTLSGFIGGGNGTEAIGGDASTPTVCRAGYANGGNAEVVVKSGTLNVSGKIGGGSSLGAGNGGNASIAMTGGTLSCKSIGGGDATTGSPGSVVSLSGAGVQISQLSDSNPTKVTTGFIGGGTNSGGTVGYATATISGGTVQGQFVLTNSGSNHSYFRMSGGTIDNDNLGGVNTGDYPRLKADGGAVYMEDSNGEVTISGGTIQNCKGSTRGGAIYMSNGTFTMSNASGSTPNIWSNTAEQGGALYMGAGSCSITAGNIGASGKPNHASNQGGGIFTNGSMTFSDGNIQYNTATNDGGGVYISGTGSLTIQGTANIINNNVTSGNGGGVYQGHIMIADGSSLNVSGNTKGTAKVQTANNVYLPNGNSIKVGSSISPSGVSLGIYTQYQANDAEVANGKIKVLTAEAADADKLGEIYEALLGGTSRMTDDRMVHMSDYDADGDPTNLYFTLLTFDRPEYTKIFVGPITNVDSLYKYMCWVNGVNGFATAHPDATGEVEADISLSDITRWIPIGSTSAFVGQFIGNGHTISDLTINGTGGYANYGLFGQTAAGSEISDLFVTGFTLTKSAPQGGLGAIVGTMSGGTMSGCVASGTLTTTSTSCTTGGLVGKQTGGDIHSSSAMTQQRGYQMGGLVGEIASGGTLKNSFANTKFTVSGGTPYVGGLVGVNGGKVENCYSRKRDDSSLGSANYGGIAGDNTETSDKGLFYSYASETPFVSAAGTAGNQTGLGTYGTTSLTNGKYGYRQSDQQIALAVSSEDTYVVNGTFSKQDGLTGLLATLNKWVGSSATYAKWTRTMGSTINGDYPIHKYDDYVCVGSTDNISLEYSNDFSTLFDGYLAANSGAGAGTIYLYKTPAALTPSGTDPEANVNVSNYGKATKLYIHEDVALKPASVSGSKATGDIEAYVGITLDNSAGTNGANPSFGGSDAIDWHFFSSALKNSQIGLHYGVPGSPTEDTEPYEAYVYPSWHATFTNANGYFPTNLNDVVGGDDYYEHWDLYGYYEPDYHWVNYKRNSASHWHEDYPGIHIYPFSNDTEFVPGKGYLVALKDEGYLQAYGTLNTNTGEGSDYIEVPLSYTSGISWTTREGHNLLGNPYQSNLDFNLFATYNSGLWGGVASAYYIIIDEDDKMYKRYVYGSSDNPFGAGRYLHPHQGFMVIVGESGMSAKFDNRMRNTTASGVTFRGDQPHYPLVNLIATDAHGNRDLVTVELGRPDKGGAPKQQALRASSCSLWCRYEDEDYALVFTQPGLEYANIRFAADEDAEFTMTWSTHNGEFNYLHLIDNMTGADIDCLSTSEYKFSARESDYNSRFRLVFDYTGIDDHEVPEPVEGPATFAYYANGEIHLTDADDDASLQIIDMTGRVIVSRDGVHTVSTTGLAAGVYVLRLTTANGTRTQKIILN